MGLPELKQNLGKKILNKLYVFTGSEVGIMDVYLNKISEISNKEKRRENSIKDIYNLLSTKSLSNKNYTYIIRDDKEFLSKEKIWKTLEKVIGNNILIIIYTNLDKRSKFYKHFQSNIIEFDKLTTIQLNQYVLRELGLKNVHSEQLINSCDHDYSRLKLEMDKIKILAEVRDCKKEEAYLIALEQGLIYNTPKTVVFDFIDAVLVRNIDLSFEYWKELKELKTAEVLILSLLYTGFRNVLLIQGSDKATSESTGLTGWQIQTTKEKTGYYSIPELINILKSIQNSESGIKTGKVESEIAVELALIKIFSEEDND